MRQHRWTQLVTLALISLVYLGMTGCAPSTGIVAPTSRSATVEPTEAPALAATPAPSELQPTPTRTAVSNVTPTATSLPTATPTPVSDKLTITILYDNNFYDQRLETAWGFSCLVQGLEKTILFDTGGDSAMLLRNLQKLGIDPGVVDVIIISHIHYDHVGGLGGFLRENSDVAVYLPRSLPESIKDTVRRA